jgi:hypothetical protein
MAENDKELAPPTARGATMINQALCNYFIGKPQEGPCRRCGGTWVQHYGDGNGQRGGPVAYVSETHEVASRNGLQPNNRPPRMPNCEFTGNPYHVWCATHLRYHADHDEKWSESCRAAV